MPNITVYVMTNWRNLPNKTSPIDETNLNHVEQGIKNVTDFINTLDASAGLFLSGAPFTQALLSKLNGIEDNANNYNLPTASTSTKGGVKVDGVTITIDQNGVISSVGGGGSSTLDGLTDVDITTPSAGQGLIYDATNSKWINGAVASAISALTDVDLTGLANGMILKWDAANSKWICANESGGGASTLNDLTDVAVTTPTNGQLLSYNATTNKWENVQGELSYNDTMTILNTAPNNGGS